jgi:hypothetical protein
MSMRKLERENAILKTKQFDQLAVILIEAQRVAQRPPIELKPLFGIEKDGHRTFVD